MASKYFRAFVASFVVGMLGVPLSVWTASTGSAQRVATSSLEHAREMQRVTIDVQEAPLATALYTIARQAGLMPAFDIAVIPSTKRVTLHLHGVTIAEAFEQALRGTGLIANVHTAGDVAIVRTTGASISIAGTVSGRVTAAATKQPLGGAKIGLDGVERVTETDADGRYHLPNVSAGSHTMMVRLLGYARVTRTIMVQDNTITTADVALDISATPLDQVVVTGTVIPTELKAVPNAITVITAKQIEERGITKIDQLFRGDVPGLFAQNQGSNALLDQVTMFSRGATAISQASAGANNGTNPIKTYVDGVEMADPQYLSQIDPKSIERIEILTGPQASTIYGSNALNGVMQIFTKRGTSHTPQLTLNLLSGWVENNYSSARTPQHDYSAQLNGVEGRLSYNAGGSWNYVGPWAPAKQTTRINAFGGARLNLVTTVGAVTADLTLRRSNTHNQQNGDVVQTYAHDFETGWYIPIGVFSGVSAPKQQMLTGQTLGFTVGYAPTSWWSHQLGIGQDISETEARSEARGYLFPGDTTLGLQQTGADRRSIRYSTTARIPITSITPLTVTAGADAWQNLTSSLSVSPQTLTGTLTGTTNIYRVPSHNTGGFLQTQLGVKDRLFLTYGLRAEWNPNFGASAQPNYAPRYGIAYTQELGSVTAKLRASYGRSTRPPQAGLSTAKTAAQIFGLTSAILLDYGNFDYDLANPDLTPEYQQGDEGGLELYLGTRGSLIVTRYNQVVNGLIDAPKVDSVRSLKPNPASGCSLTPCVLDPNAYGYRYQYQYLNIGSVRNQGWELQGSINTGPFTTRGTYSWTKSRVIGITPRYRAQFSNISSYPQYHPGATFQYLPEHTWAMGVTYAHASTTVGVNITGTGALRNLQNEFYFQNLNGAIRLPQNKQNMGVTAIKFANFNNGYAMADLNVVQHLSSGIDGTLQVQNLTDHYINDADGRFATMGRQVKAGARVRLP